MSQSKPVFWKRTLQLVRVNTKKSILLIVTLLKNITKRTKETKIYTQCKPVIRFASTPMTSGFESPSSGMGTRNGFHDTYWDVSNWNVINLSQIAENRPRLSPSPSTNFAILQSHFPIFKNIFFPVAARNLQAPRKSVFKVALDPFSCKKEKLLLQSGSVTIIFSVSGNSK